MKLNRHAKILELIKNYNPDAEKVVYDNESVLDMYEDNVQKNGQTVSD